MTCRDMGGVCDMEFTAHNAKEIIMKGEEHIKKNHPEIAEQMKKMSPDEKKKWDDEFTDKWNNTPDTR